MKRTLFLLVALLILGGNTVYAQTKFRQSSPDPMQEAFYPPELVMKYQNVIGIDEEQRAYIIKQMQQAQGKFTENEWDLQNAIQLMHEVWEEPEINERVALEYLEKTLQLEQNIKLAQLTLMIRVKNVLTREQQDKLSEIKAKMAQPQRERQMLQREMELKKLEEELYRRQKMFEEQKKMEDQRPL